MFFEKNEKRVKSINQLNIGYQFYVLDSLGEIIAEEAHKNDSFYPMASTKKVAVALAVLKGVFDEKKYRLDTIIPIQNSDFSPGRPSNSLDRYFFMPWDISDSKTIDELITYMLTESDNSSTDTLINLVGGVETINNLMKELNLDGHNLSWTSTTLLANYFNTPTTKSLSNICSISYELLTAYTLRPTEAAMVDAQSDACTPRMMANLLRFMIMEMQKPQSWVGDAAKIIFSKMEKCLTGDASIKAGAQTFLPFAQAFGSKQGGLGGIRNDTAFFHLLNGNWVILSMHSCLSPLSLEQRNKLIAEFTENILEQHRTFFQDLHADAFSLQG